jgi:hypothetical protein
LPAGSGVTPAQRLAEQSNLCARATAQADAYCSQPLRATLDTEIFRGPDFLATIQNGSGNGRVILQRWPILEITSVQIAPNSVFPRQWVTIPAGQYEPEYPVLGMYGSVAPSAAAEGGQAIQIAPGWMNWGLGRNGWILKIQHINGWPHAGLTETATAGTSELQVDDCTGWAITSAFSGVTGATGNVYDATFQEVVQVQSAAATAGPGTLTLASPLAYDHNPGVIVSTLPQSATWAVILFATAMALTRGATSTTVHSVPGQGASAGKGPEDLVGEAELLLHPYRRTF